MLGFVRTLVSIEHCKKWFDELVSREEFQSRPGLELYWVPFDKANAPNLLAFESKEAKLNSSDCFARPVRMDGTVTISNF